MPRGVKGSGKAAVTNNQTIPKKETTSRKTRKAPSKTVTQVQNMRKPYPTREERIVLADARIGRLTKINDSRKALIEKTEAALNARKAALAKGIAELESAVAMKERLLGSVGKAAKASKPKLSPEKLKALRIENIAKARAAKKKAAEDPETKPSAGETKTKRAGNTGNVRAAKKAAKTTKPKMTPEELKAFRVENLAKARAAKKAKQQT